MTVEQQIADYIAAQPEPKRSELAALDARIRALAPGARLWFLDGRDASGKIVSNPNIGYGDHEARTAKGPPKPFYRIGLSGNTTGISLYVMGLADRNHLRDTWGARIGKASVTGYCIKFRTVGDVDLGVLDEIVRERLEA